MVKPEWIGVDWGTSRLRVFAMAGDTLVQSAESDQGMASLRSEEFEPALLTLIDDWLTEADTLPVLICGMAGARQGWREAPYRAVPCTPVDEGLMPVPTKDRRIAAHILPGLKQDNPADVMRGEETQIAGFMTQEPDFDGILCLPGTHTKWVEVSAGEVVSFRTFMTGEMFDLLSKQSVLRHSVSDGWDQPVFEEAVSDTISQPEKFATRLFALRAEGLLSDQPDGVARARLSGHLIGLELAAARVYWLGRDIVVLGAEEVAQIYQDALATQSCPARIEDVEAVTLTGLRAAYHTLPESGS